MAIMFISLAILTTHLDLREYTLIFPNFPNSYLQKPVDVQKTLSVKIYAHRQYFSVKNTSNYKRTFCNALYTALDLIKSLKYNSVQIIKSKAY